MNALESIHRCVLNEFGNPDQNMALVPVRGISLETLDTAMRLYRRLGLEAEIEAIANCPVLRIKRDRSAATDQVLQTLYNALGTEDTEVPEYIF